jgi:hypothetical protein
MLKIIPSRLWNKLIWGGKIPWRTQSIHPAVEKPKAAYRLAIWICPSNDDTSKQVFIFTLLKSHKRSKPLLDCALSKMVI